MIVAMESLDAGVTMLAMLCLPRILYATLCGLFRCGRWADSV
jgi:hypothetical protein